MRNHTNPADSASAAEFVRHTVAAAACIAMLWHPVDAGAGTEDPGASMFSFSGFGTLDEVHSSEHQADFTSSLFEANGAGYTRQWSPNVDSIIGAQLAANFTPQLSAVLQVISQQDYDGGYTPHVEWANIKYQVTPDASVRIGRTVMPVFLVSDSRNVGYANPWVRPPVEIYDLEPLTDSDGVDASYRMHIGDMVDTVVGTYGRSSSRVPGDGSVEARRLWVIADTVEYGSATIHLSYAQASLTVSTLDALFDAFRQFGPAGAALADEYDADNKLARFIAVGGMYDPGGWFVTGEWGTQNLHSALGASTAWYASGGYRVAKFTPYLTYARAKANSNTSSPGLNVSALPPSLAGAATALNAGLNSLLESIAVQKTISAGVRWDFMRNVDLKLEYDHTRLGAGSSGTLSNVQPDFRPGGTVNIVSIAIDFVW